MFNRIPYLLLLLGCLPVVAAQMAGEYQVKAAMVFNIAKFTEWPSGVRETLKIAVIGKGPFSGALEGLQGKLIRNRSIKVCRVESPSEVKGCQILVVTRSAESLMGAIALESRTHSVLTISDIAGFAKSGGCVGFIEADGQMRFEVNLSALQRARIQMSSQLLKLAKIVREDR